MLTINKDIIKKFDKAGPRYTSYPTAPQWTDTFTESVYIEKLKQFGASETTLSLYIHLPFCQTMCTYCGCNVIIRPNETKHGDEYLNYLFKEIDLVAGYIGKKKDIKQFHWGGGTPTFLNNEQIKRLYNKVENTFNITIDSEIAIEIDPRTIDRDKVVLLKELGFNRISMGVQDFDIEVQESINRVQPYEKVKEFYDLCRELEFDSVNFDLIYGLPLQTLKKFEKTIEMVLNMKPDRIALYSFAYVPWLKKHQSKIDVATMPNSDEKLEIFLNSRDQLLKAGY
ncbi:MAG: oxygen-independent coproporphyrinogen-3 oxidase, partial [Candidatus Omnitrophota bacterium]